MTNMNPEFQKMYQELAAQLKQQLVVETQKLQQDQALHLEQLQNEINNQTQAIAQHQETLRILQAPATPVIATPVLRTSFKTDFKLIGNFKGNEKHEIFEEWQFTIMDYLSSYPDLNPRDSVLFVSQRLSGAAQTWYQSQVRTLNVRFENHQEILNALAFWINSSKLPTRDRDMLAELGQTSSVTDFIQKLSNIRARLTITDEEAQDKFRRGLKPEIKARVDSTSLVWTSLELLQQEALKQEGVNSYQKGWFQQIRNRDFQTQWMFQKLNYTPPKSPASLFSV